MSCCYLQKSCELGTQYAALEQEKIQLKLDLDLAKENLKKAQDEVAIMGGNNLLTVCLVIFPFYPLNRVTPLE